MTKDEKIRLAVSVARAAATSGEYRRLDKVIDAAYRKIDQLAGKETSAPARARDDEFKI